MGNLTTLMDRVLRRILGAEWFPSYTMFPDKKDKVQYEYSNDG